jgi:hypothetical protein
MTSSVLYLPKKSILFDGSADYLKIARQGSGVANLNPTGTDTFSVSAWFHTNDPIGNNVIMSNQESSGDYEGFAFTLASSRLQAAWYIDKAPGTGSTKRYAQDADTTAFNKRGWNFGVMTYDGSNNSTGFKLYLNGKQLEVTYTTSGTVGAIDSAGEVRIANANWNGPFDGALSNVAFWDKQLSEKEVTEIYRGRGGAVGPGDLRRHSATANCIGWWIADNPSDAYDGTIYDEKGSFDMTPIGLASDALQDLAP